MLALEKRTEYGENGHQDDGIPEGNQPAPNRRADAVGGIVSPDIPPYIDPGANENKNKRFYAAPFPYFVSKPLGLTASGYLQHFLKFQQKLSMTSAIISQTIK